jgi:hypothetical protein
MATMTPNIAAFLLAEDECLSESKFWTIPVRVREDGGERDSGLVVVSNIGTGIGLQVGEDKLW